MFLEYFKDGLLLSSYSFKFEVLQQYVFLSKLCTEGRSLKKYTKYRIETRV